MHPDEKNILEQLKKNAYISSDALDSLPLGTLSPEFYNDSCLSHYCEKHSHRKQFILRLTLEKYLGSDNAHQYLEYIEGMLKSPLPFERWANTHRLQNKLTGTYLMPVSSSLIRQIYQLENLPLINLFQHYFPVPSAELFVDNQLPAFIQKREAEVLETLANIDVKKAEPLIIKLQRLIRMKKRHKEEAERISERDTDYLLASHKSSYEELQQHSPAQIHQWAEQLIDNASTPYTPQCAPELSNRIMAAARKVSAFTTVKHITSKAALRSIFDQALYGRRTLLDFYLPFSPTSLHECDVLNGDANVICLGPKKIDAFNEITIEFDLAPIIQGNPSAFYKQLDLQYVRNKERQVQLGNELLTFDHTGFVRCADSASAYLKIIDSEHSITHIARAPKSLFISYNLKQIHEILTLNFFRFIDQMSDKNYKLDQEYITQFYGKVNQLTDEELITFLTDLEKGMTDTAEFNFYGAHQIDFATVINIYAEYKRYKLNIPTFMNDLKQGNLDALRQARIKIPELFQSYRFLNYLLSQELTLEVSYYLDELRQQCKTPAWVTYARLSIPEDFIFCWDMHPIIQQETVGTHTTDTGFKQEAQSPVARKQMFFNQNSTHNEPHETATDDKLRMKQ